MQKVYKLTKERLTELENELHFLKTVREQEVADQIKEARSFGDLSENSEYDEAKNEQGKVFSRIAELEGILSNVSVINELEGAADEVVTGVKVVVEDIDSGSREQYYLVGSQEANPAQSRISDESPFGRALLGKRVGDEIIVEAPAATLRYRLNEIVW